MNHLYAAHSFWFLLQERKKIQQKFFKLKAKKIGGSELFIELFVCIHKYNNTHTYTGELNERVSTAKATATATATTFRLIFACKFARNCQQQ